MWWGRRIRPSTTSPPHRHQHLKSRASSETRPKCSALSLLDRSFKPAGRRWQQRPNPLRRGGTRVRASRHPARRPTSDSSQALPYESGPCNTDFEGGSLDERRYGIAHLGRLRCSTRRSTRSRMGAGTAPLLSA